MAQALSVERRPTTVLSGVVILEAASHLVNPSQPLEVEVGRACSALLPLLARQHLVPVSPSLSVSQALGQR